MHNLQGRGTKIPRGTGSTGASKSGGGDPGESLNENLCRTLEINRKISILAITWPTQTRWPAPKERKLKVDKTDKNLHPRQEIA